MEVVKNSSKKEEQQSVKVPSYLMHGKHKCNTPKDIIPFEIDGYNSIVYGDPRLNGKIRFTEESLQNAKGRGYLIVALKKPKKRGGQVGIPVPYINVLESRKKRLANFLNMERIKINEGLSKQELVKKGFSVSHILCRELGIDTKKIPSDVRDLFLTSAKNSIICSDIKRILHLKFEESWNNGK